MAEVSKTAGVTAWTGSWRLPTDKRDHQRAVRRQRRQDRRAVASLRKVYGRRYPPWRASACRPNPVPRRPRLRGTVISPFRPGRAAPKIGGAESVGKQRDSEGTCSMAV